jgi:hypothetical protein
VKLPESGCWKSCIRVGAVAVLTAATLALLLFHASVYSFFCDDAFISFRYARNLSHGYGLVFNPGFERVEGYSNFLWVLILAGFSRLGLAPESVSHILTIAATVVLWGLVAWFAFRTPPAKRWWLLLVSPLFLAATRSVAVWSTSGLETRLFEVLIVGATLRLVVEVEASLAGRTSPRFVSPVLFGLATVTRPDALLISTAALGAAGVLLAVRRRLTLRSVALPMALYVAMVGGHEAFRLIYYGQWLPNTYYAKVDSQTWWDMGATYLGVFALEYAVYLWVPLLIAACFAHRSRRTLFVPLLFGAVVIPHAIYIASIGGDHFEYRPLDLYFPFFFLLLYDGAKHLARGTISTACTAIYLVAILVGLTALPCQSHSQFPDAYVCGFPGGTSDHDASAGFLLPERDPIYRLPGLRLVGRAYLNALKATTGSWVGTRQEEHRLLAAMLTGEAGHFRRLMDAGLLPADTYIALSPMGIVPYRTNLRVLDLYGLTDVEVAHSGFYRGPRMMAHRKRASFDYACRRGVDLWPIDSLRLLRHVGDRDLFADTVKLYKHEAPAYYADVGDGCYVVALLPQGISRARQRFPKLRFESPRDPAFFRKVLREIRDENRRQLAARPGDQGTMWLLADVLMFVGETAEAAGYYEVLVTSHPDDALLWTNLSLAHWGSGNQARALAALTRGRELAQLQGRSELMSKCDGLAARYLSRSRPPLPTEATRPPPPSSRRQDTPAARP